jgi:hypothetical protein
MLVAKSNFNFVKLCYKAVIQHSVRRGFANYFQLFSRTCLEDSTQSDWISSLPARF